ncbi:isopentenyl phosphate kinase [Candidatus Lokiarchaeum ossiferum]|uniref:isopentenyl phosphate kinase n=1 Tax=Candidatus Lokiarchaeum ossiferum TaxID=2951803 RepID=UPI00352F8D8D
MTNTQDITIIKIGGSVITDKNIPFSLKEDVLDDLIDQIQKADQKCIIVHGAGSFAHPLAKKYRIVSGRNNEIEDQIIGLIKTHNGVAKLNSIILNKFLEKKIPAMPIQPSAVFYQKRFPSGNLITVLIKLLDLKITPILYGDIIFGQENDFSIISGDKIIEEICKQFVDLKKPPKYRIRKVIFCFDEDGLYIEDADKKKKLLSNIEHKKIDSIKFFNLGLKIDVTGGILGKLEETKKICKLKIPVQLINGKQKNFLLKALQQQKILSTTIY